MSDTVQVVRMLSGLELEISPVGVISVFNVSAQEWMPLGVAMELTEERSGKRFRTSNGTPVPRRRLVSEWRSDA